MIPHKCRDGPVPAADREGKGESGDVIINRLPPHWNFPHQLRRETWCGRLHLWWASIRIPKRKQGISIMPLVQPWTPTWSAKCFFFVPCSPSPSLLNHTQQCTGSAWPDTSLHTHPDTLDALLEHFYSIFSWNPFQRDDRESACCWKNAGVEVGQTVRRDTSSAFRGLGRGQKLVRRSPSRPAVQFLLFALYTRCCPTFLTARASSGHAWLTHHCVWRRFNKSARCFHIRQLLLVIFVAWLSCKWGFRLQALLGLNKGWMSLGWCLKKHLKTITINKEDFRGNPH